MLLDLCFLKKQLQQVIVGKQAQGYQTAGLLTKLHKIESYDALAALAQEIAALPFRPDWTYREPNQLDAIWQECAVDRPTKSLCQINLESIAGRAETAFLSAVCGCILGKPLEVNPTLDEIRKAAESCNEWPLNDYISNNLLKAIGRQHVDTPVTARENIQYVAPDDDINYTVLGMMTLEKHGARFTKKDLMEMWLRNLPPGWTFGPERMVLARAAINGMEEGLEPQFDLWASEWNPTNEACGAAIRVDAYGYAAPGHPALAAEMAWRDSSFTHNRTGIYSSMFIAAAIATAFVADKPMDIFETALKFVPQKSRFYETMFDCFQMVAKAPDWLDGYEQIHHKYGAYGHCQIYQECGLLINSARFAKDIPDAFCKQVSQGCDTDCFGEIIGSIMGAYFGPGHLDERWLKPFNDDLRTSLGNFYERSLMATARRMGNLPSLVLGSL